jgi:NAD(P)-dependent dehydrogenase (short-subunit alcohol dehydrogenase family)
MLTQPVRPAIFITGAAAGIGRATALRFARGGWFVGATDADPQALQRLRQELGTDHFTAPLDVCDADAWAATLAAYWQAAGQRLDVLLNNAGIAVTAAFEEAPVQRHQRLVDVNLKGVIHGCHAAHRYLRQTRHSLVINMCSASALYGQPMLSTYSATKAAVRSLTEALNIEWARQGIQVTDLLPLFVNTDMVRHEVSRMKTVGVLGVKLSAEDIAQQAWARANARHRRLSVHTHVGLQTKVFALLAKLSPDAVNRLVTAKLGGY